jgi:uncharacterized protein (DUF1499 family)
MDGKFSGVLATLLIIWGCSSKPTDNRGGKNGSLAPCPGAPNCVSTLSHDSRHAMPPLPYISTKDQNKDRIIEIIKSMKRSEIIDISDTYVHAQFKTRFLRFVDDVSFFFDDAAQIVHFRSASRVGYYDFGLNRRRMSMISKRYLSK